MDKKLVHEGSTYFELLTIYPYSSSIQRFDEISSNCPPEDLVQQDKHSIKARILEPEGEEVVVGDRILRGLVSFGTRFVVPSPEGEKEKFNILAHIEAVFAAEYSIIKEEISDAAFEEFLKFNVVHNVWPFWREFAFRSADSMQLPKPTISLMRGRLASKTTK